MSIIPGKTITDWTLDDWGVHLVLLACVPFILYCAYMAVYTFIWP